MSQLGDPSAARASNGGSRSAGPVPVPSNERLLTPRDVMRNRNAREAARREALIQKDEEQKRQAAAEERRRSAERRAAAAVPGVAAPRFSNTSSQYSPQDAVYAGQATFEEPERRQSRAVGEVASTNVLGDPTGRSQQGVPQASSSTRARGPVAAQQAPSAQVPVGSRRAQVSQSAPRQAAPSASSSVAAAADSASRPTPASFPHAFERWEQLSSHWEGLTSYWLRRLETNTDEIREAFPNAATLNRQITDLSAAGANLFHAVVELQRLRASSERKFQRWFFDTREDMNQQNEQLAELRRQLEKSREQVTKQRADDSIELENAKREVLEMRRELMISKDEARRAWEELGKRNQESLDTAQSLREGRVTTVAGVQVLPYLGSRTGSAYQRPSTRDGMAHGSAGVPSTTGGPQAEAEYYRQTAVSPSNTDPFTDSGRPHGLHHEPGRQALAQGAYSPYAMTGTPASAATAQTVVPTAGAYSQSPSQAAGPSRNERVAPASSPEAHGFYHHGGAGTLLHSPQTSTQNIPGTAATTASFAGPSGSNHPRSDLRSEPSYVDTISEGDIEYAIDAQGHFQTDAEGRPIPFTRREPVRSSESGEDLETADALRRERDFAAQYGASIIPEAPAVPSTAAHAMATYTPAEPADYTGQGYGGWDPADFGRGTAHHHPTRLSDVLEEDEERSSRRTGD